MIGERALITDATRSATVTATTHAFLLRVDSTFLGRLSDADRNAFFATLYQFVATILAKRLEQASNRLAQVEAELHQLKAAPDPGSGRYKI